MEKLGWKLMEITEQLALIEPAEWRFYLQDYYVKEWAENFVIFISVEDAQAWHDHSSTSRSGFAADSVTVSEETRRYFMEGAIPGPPSQADHERLPN